MRKTRNTATQPTARHRLSGILGAAAGSLALAATTIMTGATPASAHNSFEFAFFDDGFERGYSIFNTTRGRVYAGQGYWRQDPLGSLPGDTLGVQDLMPDGYGVEAYLSTGRVASTRGHSSPWTDEKSGNLPEGNEYILQVCVVKGTWQTCSPTVTVWA
ncbi:hypothetical protein ACWEFL_07280 [Streptomyces sp. NPDC004838]